MPVRSRDEIPGSKWWKFDFHAHTPKCTDYAKHPGDETLRNREPREWLLDFMRAGIDCVAVTDHNSGEWIDVLKSNLEAMAAAEPRHPDYRPLHLFPGVEISVNAGVHLLAIFEPSKGSDDITALLGAVGYGGTRGDSDAVTSKSMVEVLDAVGKVNGIAIPAHADDDNGLFETLSGTDLEGVLKSPHVCAVEVRDTSKAKPQLYVDKKLNWTEILGSDSHRPSEIGRQYTWVKMGEPNLQGLRLALLDGRPLSIIRSDEVASDYDPNAQQAARVIESVEIREARYMGRGTPFAVALSPWLNAVVGGRGTGKSTLLEFIRIAMRREDELAGEVKQTFEKFRQVYPSRDDQGALTETTSVTAVYNSEGVRFRVPWQQAGAGPSIEENGSDGAWHVTQGDIRQRFPIRIYSQKQIFQLAGAPEALLGIIDDDPVVNRREWEERRRTEEKRFLTLRAQGREIEAALAEEGTVRGDLDGVKRKLDVFESAGHREVLQQYQRFRRQSRAVEDQEASFKDAPRQLRELAETIIPSDLDTDLFADESDENREVLSLAGEARSGFETIQRDLIRLAEEAERLTAQWSRKIEESSWQSLKTSAEQAYNDLVQRLQGEGQDPSAYGRLVQQRQVLEQKLANMEGEGERLGGIQEELQRSLKRLEELRRDITQRRRRFLEGALATNPHVRMRVVPYGGRERVEEEFRAILGTDRFEKDILSEDGQNGILAELFRDYPDSVGIEDFEQRLQTLKEGIECGTRGEQMPGVRDQRYAQFVKTLRPETIDRLFLWFPEDTLAVEYSPTGDGKGFRSIEQGSAGQKTAAILAFLLAYGDEPMILDQPEDDLDNHLVYDLIVRQLRENKQRRQILVVTHNPNIVVNGDAELVLALDFRAGQSHVVQQGGLQNRDVRQEICRVMEGGEEAFDKRYNRIRIAGGGRHV